MYGRIHAWPACALALAVVCGLAATATAQQPVLPNAPGYGTAANMVEPAPVYHGTHPGYHAVSNSFTADDPALADRVADLEGELKKIQDAEAAAKRRAAGRPSISVRGRMHLDTALFSGSALDDGNWADNTENGTKFRRTRLGAGGAMFDVYRWQIEMDFAGRSGNFQQTAFKDVFLEMTDLPYLRTIKIGHFKEPASLEELTSSNHITMMERSVVNCFIPARNIGVQVGGPNELETATFHIGLFREVDETPPVSKSQSGGNNVTMRATWLPWYDEATEGRGLLHVGGYYSYRDCEDDELRFRQRPDNSFSGRFVDTRDMDATHWHLVGVELAMVYGPFSVQSEYVKALVNRPEDANVGFDATYVEVSYWLTGEHRAYRRSSGRFDRVTPFENVFRVRDEDGFIRMGRGAWQLTYRYGYIDLVDGDVNGGLGNVHTMGVNWHLTRNSRLMANYIQATRGGEDGYLNAVTMRAQFDF